MAFEGGGGGGLPSEIKEKGGFKRNSDIKKWKILFVGRYVINTGKLGGGHTICK